MTDEEHLLKIEPDIVQMKTVFAANGRLEAAERAAEIFHKYVYADLAYNSKYRVILMGQVPHSTTGTAHSGSVLAELENHPDKYPRVLALRTETGDLKITKSNFKKALEMLLEERYIAA